MQLLEDFGRVFKCKVGSGMRPGSEDLQCSMWGPA